MPSGRGSIFLSVLLAAPLCLPLTAQQQSPPQQQQSVINFFVEVNGVSVNQLIQTVNAQIRAGISKITILISSTGGDTASAFTAYNYLKGVPAEITTFNVGNVDSAATIIYCAGHYRYSLPGTRFLIHGAAIQFSGTGFLDAQTLDNQVQIIQNQNRMIAHVVSATTNKKEAEMDTILKGQKILTPEEAKAWGLVQAVKTDFFQPGATLVSINLPVPMLGQNEPEYTVLPSNPLKPNMRISGGDLFTPSDSAVTFGSCGIVPIKPIPPIGCKDLRPECVCDSSGNNCHWEWVCVPN
ncbi:MAG: ATP-dependent Clp protease proteolytic subunit [Candidatus Korobacteraceae bacterium]|jgi:ATP-dependent Clp protease, protease subunit